MSGSSARSASAGWSIFTIDPGETTGWAWACIGRRELEKHGHVEALEQAAKHRSGALAHDTRFMCGEIPLRTSGRLTAVERELNQAKDITIQMEVCGNMALRTSGGKVQGITDCIFEDFILRERTKDRNLLSPVRCTAYVRALLWQSSFNIKVFKTYSPSDAKNVVTDKRLRSWGFWQRGSTHARDAVRHLLLHLRHIEQDM